MMITILLICFVLIFFSLGILLCSRIKIKEILLSSVLVFSTLLVLITEVTSALHLLNFQFILLSWSGIAVLNILYLFSKREAFFIFTKSLKQYINQIFLGLTKFEKLIGFSSIALLAIIFIQGIVYPPNNWDSMTYHLARITNWISHQSVAHYPTHIIRQIYQPPFSEYVIMHFNILNVGDYFSNSVQFIFLFFSLVAIVSIVELFGLGRKYKLIAVVLAITIPEVILQASSTQNDIVVSFFILTSIYFAVKAVNEVNLQNYLFLGLSIGLGVLTKGTAYIYFTPILLIFTIVVFINIFKTQNYAFLGYSIIAAIIFLSVNTGPFIRNYNLNANILGVDKNESKMYSNEKMTPVLLLSNIIKNAGLHIGPYPINKVSDKVIYKLHLVAGIDINNSGTNFLNMEYSGAPDIPNHEDSASNTIHFFLILLSFLLIGLTILKHNKAYSKIMTYSAMIVLQVILFCLYLKWQPWHTRLHTPLFMLSVPLICYAISLNNQFIKALKYIFPIILFSALFVIIFNNRRPIISNRFTSEICITDNRYKKYFASRLNMYEEYLAIKDNIDSMKNRNIGLIVGGDDWEYPLFSQLYGREINPVHVKVTNITKDISLYLNPVDCIISTILNDTVIEFNGKRFYNQNSSNKSIWLYNKIRPEYSNNSNYNYNEIIHFSKTGFGNKYCGIGWSEAEPWRTWSDGNSALLVLS